MREKSDLLIRAGSSRGLDISKGERVMIREKTTLNNPIRSSIGKKVLPRNTTEEDVKDYISKSHRLAHMGKKTRKLYKEEEEEPSNELDHTPIFPSPLDASDKEKSSIKKPDLILDDMKGLGFGPHLSPVFELFLVSLRARELVDKEEFLSPREEGDTHTQYIVLIPRLIYGRVASGPM